MLGHIWLSLHNLILLHSVWDMRPQQAPSTSFCPWLCHAQRDFRWHFCNRNRGSSSSPLPNQRWQVRRVFISYIKIDDGSSHSCLSQFLYHFNRITAWGSRIANYKAIPNELYHGTVSHISDRIRWSASDRWDASYLHRLAISSPLVLLCRGAASHTLWPHVPLALKVSDNPWHFFHLA